MDLFLFFFSPIFVGIPAEGYVTVGVTLLRAIREVLGEEIATDAVIDAWKAAYFQLADILIAAEEAAYKALESAPGGWRGKRAFVLWKKEAESDTVTSLYFKAEDGKPIIAFEAGQYIGLCPVIEGSEVRRNYSLSDAPNGEYFRISVKREEGGLVSQYLHDKMNIGDKMDLLPPSGHFSLVPSSKPLVLLSAGIGLTPVLSMLNQALVKEPSRPITFIHFARNHKHHPFHLHLQELARKYPNLTYYFAHTQPIADAPDAPHHVGKLDLSLLQKWLPSGTRDIDVYFLGPKSFMALTKHLLLEAGVPETQSKYEFFGPHEALGKPACPFAAGKAAPAGATCPFAAAN